MPENTLKMIRGLVQSAWWNASHHVLTDIEDGIFDERDLECSIATGTIRKIEDDEQDDAIDGKKYTITGVSSVGLPFETCGKIIEWIDGQRYFFITGTNKEKSDG